jgi:phage gpG-like protein
MAQVTTTYNVDTSALRDLLAGRNGAVWKDIRNRGVAVKNRAVQNISAGEMKAVRTGRLKASIAMEMVIDDGAPTAIVGTNVEYAKSVHDGTRRMRSRPFLEKALPAAFNP